MPLAAVPDPEAMGAKIQARANSSLFQIAGQRAVEEGVKLVTFGHTHDASVEDAAGRRRVHQQRHLDLARRF